MNFTAGQCWISEMEPELGLGIVINAEFQRVTIMFQGSDTTRTYSAANAPLKRVMFNVGDRVKTQEGTEFEIEDVTDNNGVFIYSGDGVKVPEAGLSGDISFCKPETRLMSGHHDQHDWFELRLEALRNKHQLRKSPLRGIIGGRVDVIPHQFYIAHEALIRHRPRLLLADEVGLGKTIEACMIMHGLLLRGLASRVLVVVPEVLVNQWFVELLRKFNLTFSIINDESLQPNPEDDDEESPFESSQLCLCALNTAVKAAAKGQMSLTGWDLLIVDEAHHLEWSPEQPSVEYLMIEQLAASTPAVLLLTATPEHHGLEGHFARLRLLDPERYYDLEKFRSETRHYKRTAEVVGKLMAGETLENGEHRFLTTLISHDEQVKLDYSSERARDKFIGDLLDRHGIGRVMYRNTRTAMKNFPKRRPQLIKLEPGCPDDSIRPEVTWLSEFLHQFRKRKVLLICGGMDDAIAVKEEFESISGVTAAVFHEGMTLIQRDRTAAWFAEPDGARLLICSEIGSEGRNFQFAHDLVLMKLPLDPELLEQRIGRLDRIGQTSDIRIHVPYVSGSRDEFLARWFHEGLASFSHSLHGGARIMQRFEPELNNLLDSSKPDMAEFEKLLKETAEFRSKVEAELESGRDKLLELNSYRPEMINEMISQLENTDQDTKLEQFMLKLYEFFGIKYEEMSERSYLLKPEDLLTDAFPGIKHDGTTVTWNRSRALSRDDIQFLSWDHPMINGAIDLLIGSESGNSSIAILDGSEEHNGNRLILETVFVLESVAPSELHIDRFLPPEPLLFAVNERGEPVTQPDASLLKSCHTPPSPELLRRVIPDLLEASHERAKQSCKRILAGSLHHMKEWFNEEIRRTKALREVNDHIREDEIDIYIDHRDRIDQHIRKARLRLDAIRLVMIQR